MPSIGSGGLNQSLSLDKMIEQSKTSNSRSGKNITQAEMQQIQEKVMEDGSVSEKEVAQLKELSKDFVKQGQTLNLGFGKAEGELKEPKSFSFTISASKESRISATYKKSVKNKKTGKVEKVVDHAKTNRSNKSLNIPTSTKEVMSSKGKEIMNGVSPKTDAGKGKILKNILLQGKGGTEKLNTETFQNPKITNAINKRIFANMERDGMMTLDSYGKDTPITVEGETMTLQGLVDKYKSEGKPDAAAKRIALREVSKQVTEIAKDAASGGSVSKNDIKLLQFAGNAMGLNNVLAQFMEGSSTKAGKEAGIDGVLGPRTAAALDEMFRAILSPIVIDIPENTDVFMLTDNSGSMMQAQTSVKATADVNAEKAKNIGSSFEVVEGFNKGSGNEKIIDSALKFIQFGKTSGQDGKDVNFDFKGRDISRDAKIIMQTDNNRDMTSMKQLQALINVSSKSNVDVVIQNPSSGGSITLDEIVKKCCKPGTNEIDPVKFDQFSDPHPQDAGKVLFRYDLLDPSFGLEGR